MRLALILALFLASFALSACQSALPKTPPPLRDMEEPIALKNEPDDEAARKRLPLGSFTGAYVKSAWLEEPDEPGQEPDALEIVRVIENSPAAAAGLRVGDLLLSASTQGEDASLAWPAQWRKIELDATPGAMLKLRLDRAGAARSASLRLTKRVQPRAREAVEMFRETKAAGIVLRTATAVEARSAGLAAGGGAILIGLSANSPWRSAGMRFGDMVTHVMGQAVHHPQVVLTAIRSADPDGSLTVQYQRDGKTLSEDIPMTQRESNISDFSIFGLFSYSEKRDRTETSFLLGLFGWESTPAAWELTLLWLIRLRGGDADVLEEVKR